MVFASLHGLSVINANFSKLELRNKAKMLPIFLLFASSGEVQSFFHASSGHEPNKPGTGEFFYLPSSTNFYTPSLLKNGSSAFSTESKDFCNALLDL